MLRHKKWHIFAAQAPVDIEASIGGDLSQGILYLIGGDIRGRKLQWCYDEGEEGGGRVWAIYSTKIPPRIVCSDPLVSNKTQVIRSYPLDTAVTQTQTHRQ